MTHRLVDIGNSTTVYATYKNNQIACITKIDTGLFKEQEMAGFFIPENTYTISSVVPQIDTQIKDLDNVTLVTSQNIRGIKLNLDKPNEVGADRLVNALAAYSHVQSECLVIDSGTALTCCYVSRDGTYEGGLIFPGMGIASKALNDYTAKIPYIQVASQEKLVGKSTKEAVEIGLYQGYIQLINGLIAQYKQAHPHIKVIGTGTGLEVLKDQLNLDELRPHLILEGLSFI